MSFHYEAANRFKGVSVVTLIFMPRLSVIDWLIGLEHEKIAIDCYPPYRHEEMAQIKEPIMSGQIEIDSIASDQIPEWLDAIVTEEAKRDPDWRRKAKSGFALISPEEPPEKAD